MSSAGQQLVANRVPAERIATAIATADGTSATTDTSMISVVAALVQGRTYRVTLDSAIEGGAVADRVVVRIYEDSVGGNAIQVRNLVLQTTAGTAGNPCHLEAEFTAIATGNKTFVAAHDTAAAGAVNMAAAASFPTYFYVDYIRGGV